jgi:hypothetical protein
MIAPREAVFTARTSTTVPMDRPFRSDAARDALAIPRRNVQSRYVHVRLAKDNQR